MDKYIQDYIDSAKAAFEAICESRRLMDVAVEKATMPINLRPATADDITVESLIWYPKTKYWEEHWAIVDEVLCPNDQYKAYSAHDGCRHGLSGAFVEDK